MRVVSMTVILFAFFAKVHGTSGYHCLQGDTLILDSVDIKEINLDNIEVKGQVPQTKMGKEGIITIVKGTYLSMTGSLMNVLGQIPNVNVRDGQISITGRGTPQIYVDGKMITNLYLLYNIRSEDIKDVEVITNPLAGYSSETLSVIRIRLNKKDDGWGGKVWSQARLRKHGLNTLLNPSVNYRRGGLDVSANIINYNFGNCIEQTGFMNIIDVVNQSYSQINKRKANMRSASIQINYEFNKKQSTGVNIDVFKEKTESNGNIEYDNKSSDNSQRLIIMKTKGKTELRPNFVASAYYSGKIEKMDIRFDTDYVHGSSMMSLHSIVDYGDINTFRNVFSHDKDNHRMLASKLVVCYPIWKGSLESGAEYVNTHRCETFNSEGANAANSDDDIVEKNIAGFLKYDVELADWQFSLGLRYENITARYMNFQIHNKELNYDQGNLCPSASIGYTRNQLALRLAYSKKISRPTYKMLSGNRQYDNDYIYEGGNPFLSPTISKTLSLDANYKWLRFSSYYSVFNNYVSTMDERYGTESVLLTQHNISKCKSIMVSMGFSQKIGIWNPRYDVSVVKNDFDYSSFGINDNYSHPIWVFKFNNFIQLPWNMLLNLNYQYQTAGNDENKWMKPNNHLDLSIRRTFFKNKLTISISGYDIFQTNKTRWDVNYRYCFSSINRITDTRSLQIELIYIFKSVNSKYKGRGAGNAEKQRF